jgi:hypothetical protein
MYIGKELLDTMHRGKKAFLIQPVSPNSTFTPDRPIVGLSQLGRAVIIDSSPKSLSLINAFSENSQYPLEDLTRGTLGILATGIIPPQSLL